MLLQNPKRQMCKLNTRLIENPLLGRLSSMDEDHPPNRGGSYEQRKSREWKFLHHVIGERHQVCLLRGST